MRNRGVRGEQWTQCAVCGFDFPMSMLTVQDGQLKCARCYDNPEPKRREKTIQRILESQGAEQEGVDLRVVDMAFFAGLHDEEVT